MNYELEGWPRSYERPVCQRGLARRAAYGAGFRLAARSGSSSIKPVEGGGAVLRERKTPTDWLWLRRTHATGLYFRPNLLFFP